MAMRLRFNVNQHAITELGLPGGLVDQAVAKASGKTRDRARRNLTQTGRVDTGALRQSIVSERTIGNGQRVTYQVGSPLPYALYNEQGTGLYGPHHSYIYPRRARVLRFKPGKNSTIVAGPDGYAYFPRVKGIEGTRFLERALFELTADDFT